MRIIRSIIEDGYVIMVGRGGVAFSQYANISLNILLQAPIPWRLDRIREKRNLSQEAALKYMNETDRERRLLVDHFYGLKTDTTIYDIVINCSSFTAEEIADSIYRLLIIKKML